MLLACCWRSCVQLACGCGVRARVHTRLRMLGIVGDPSHSVGATEGRACQPAAELTGPQLSPARHGASSRSSSLPLATVCGSNRPCSSSQLTGVRAAAWGAQRAAESENAGRQMQASFNSGSARLVAPVAPVHLRGLFTPFCAFGLQVRWLHPLPPRSLTRSVPCRSHLATPWLPPTHPAPAARPAGPVTQARTRSAGAASSSAPAAASLGATAWRGVAQLPAARRARGGCRRSLHVCAAMFDNLSKSMEKARRIIGGWASATSQLHAIANGRRPYRAHQSPLNTTSHVRSRATALTRHRHRRGRPDHTVTPPAGLTLPLHLRPARQDGHADGGEHEGAAQGGGGGGR